MIGFHPLAVIFLLAIVFNLILAIAVPRVDWDSAGEIPHIAASIATGRGFSSPFRVPTGPSVWAPPIYPYLLAGIFRVFGVFTVASYWAAVAFNLIVHGFACVLLYCAAGEAFGRLAGWCAAIALASFPLLFEPLVLLHVLGGYLGQGLFIPPNLTWATHLSELAIILLVWLILRRTHWAAYGVAWGAAALINAGILAMLPAFLAWQLYHRESWRRLTLAGATAALCVAPWLARNYVVFHQPVFIRDGFGIELRDGNQPGHRGLWDGDVHPDRNPYELRRLAELGEIEFDREARQQAMASIRARPGEFLYNTLLRIGYFWIGTPLSSRSLGVFRFLKYTPPLVFSLMAFCGIGLAVKNGNQKALLFAAVLFFYPLVYYITDTFSGFNYQYAIQPEMLALATSVVIRNGTAGPVESLPAT